MGSTSSKGGGTTHSVPQVAWFVGLTLLMTGAAAAGSTTLGPALQFVLALGPAVIALALAWRTGTMRELMGTLKRPTDARWYVVAIITPAAVSLGVVAVAMILGLRNSGFFSGLTATALIVPLVVFLPALAEELAWRGFAFARLVGSMSPLAASLVLAAPWALLHLTLYLPGQPFDGLAVWPSVASIVTMSVIASGLFLRSGGNALVTTLFHASFNATTPLTLPVDADVAWALRPILLGVVAVAVVVLGGLRSPESRQPRPASAEPAFGGAAR